MTAATLALSHRLRPFLAAICLGAIGALVSVPALARGPEGIADVAEKVIDAVVNISTSQTVEAKGDSKGAVPQLPPGSPFEEFFDDFFKNRRGPGGKGGGNNELQPHKTNSLGSGFIIDTAGIVVTNNHVIADADEITVILHENRSLKGALRKKINARKKDYIQFLEETVAQVQALCAAGKMELRTFWEVKAIHGGDWVEGVTIHNSKTKQEEHVAVDAVIPQLGFLSSLGAIAEWGLDIDKGDIKVASTMETNIPGIFAAGDITSYPGKLKLIATGVAEASIAVNHAVHFINPAAKVAPGHSSNMALFGQSED